MTIQRMNYTNRKRLTREQANIVIHPPRNGEAFATFDAQLELSAIVPTAPSARVFVEAYHQATRTRYDFGRVASLTPPPISERRLSEFTDWSHVRFRVKVSDESDLTGRIVAWANSIRPKGTDDKAEPDLVRFLDSDLHGRLWDIEFDEAGPIVLIERAAGGSQHVGRDRQFLASVYPEILRRTLHQALLVDQVSPDDPNHWFTIWYHGFLKSKLGLPEPPDEPVASQLEWIDEAVQSFARKFRVADYWKIDDNGVGGPE